MPTYDYRCTACGHEVEVVHGIHADGPSTCEVCGGQMRKALSPPAIHFRGAGWAKKDARAASSSKGAGAGSTSKDAGKEGGSGESGSGSTSTDSAGDSGSTAAASGADAGARGSKGTTPAKSPT